VGWRLEDAEEQNRIHPRSFFIPPERERKRLKPGELAKLVFLSDDPADPRGERMWVIVDRAAGGRYVGKLDNDPVVIKGLAAGDEIHFEPRHVASIWSDEKPAFPSNKQAVANRRIVEEDIQPRVLIFEAPTKPADSGWTFLLGDESAEAMNDRETFLAPNLGWLVERYPALLPVVKDAKPGVHVYDERKRKFRFEG
jgi:hypothetical protein